MVYYGKASDASGALYFIYRLCHTGYLYCQKAVSGMGCRNPYASLSAWNFAVVLYAGRVVSSKGINKKELATIRTHWNSPWENPMEIFPLVCRQSGVLYHAKKTSAVFREMKHSENAAWWENHQAASKLIGLYKLYVDTGGVFDKEKLNLRHRGGHRRGSKAVLLERRVQGV